MPFFARKVNLHWRSLHGSAWEQFVTDVFRKRGYWVKPAPGESDDGVDLIATYDDQRIAIQCRGGVDEVNSEAVQQVIAGQAIHKCTRAAIVTNSAFTGDAKKVGKASGCWLVDANEFAALAGDRSLTVKSKSPSLFARMCIGLWELLVRLFGMTLAVLVLLLGVAAIGAMLFFLAKQLEPSAPSNVPIDVPHLPEADPTAVGPDSSPPALEEDQGVGGIGTLSTEKDARPADIASPTGYDEEDSRPPHTAREKSRTWTSASGDFSVDAVFLGYEEGKVKLQKVETDEIISVELDALSDLDKKIVGTRLKRARFEQRKRAQPASE